MIRLSRDCWILAVVDGYLWYRYLTHNPFELPTLGPDAIIWAPIAVLFAAIVLMMMMPLFSGRSPHVVVRPEEIEALMTEVARMDGADEDTHEAVVREFQAMAAASRNRLRGGFDIAEEMLVKTVPEHAKEILGRMSASVTEAPFAVSLVESHAPR